MAAVRPRPVTITVQLGKADTDSHLLADCKDWAVIFENVLEIKTSDGVHYYPLDSIRKWSVKNSYG